MTIDDSNKFIQELRNKKIFILAALEQETENIEG